MISSAEIAEAGRFNKPHGIKGEISATLDVDVDLSRVKCIILDVDGIFVPFFITSVRPKTADTYLITLDGIDSEQKAKAFTLRPFWVLLSDLPEDDDDEDSDGFYAADLIGYRVSDRDFGDIGTIEDIDDTTVNVLFVVATPAGTEVLLPVADEFILFIDPEKRVIGTAYPDGILETGRR
ncbi:MAG: 16S rRNA processing protein RimM [Muribaculaceae bacterium]|nr:16S rRNA processing protein RimM [Muribaculaceae bacterium]